MYPSASSFSKECPPRFTEKIFIHGRKFGPLFCRPPDSTVEFNRMVKHLAENVNNNIFIRLTSTVD